jgi:hypothetical protein
VCCLPSLTVTKTIRCSIENRTILRIPADHARSNQLPEKELTFRCTSIIFWRDRQRSVKPTKPVFTVSAQFENYRFVKPRSSTMKKHWITKYIHFHPTQSRSIQLFDFHFAEIQQSIYSGVKHAAACCESAIVNRIGNAA